MLRAAHPRGRGNPASGEVMWRSQDRPSSRRSFCGRLLCSIGAAMATSFAGASAASSQPLPESSPPEPPGASSSSSDGSSSIPSCLASSSPPEESDRVAWLASALLHEAQHQRQYDEGDAYYGPAAEHTASAVQ